MPHEYAKARQEFKAALLVVVAFHHPGAPAEVERDCTHLLSLVARKNSEGFRAKMPSRVNLV